MTEKKARWVWRQKGPAQTTRKRARTAGDAFRVLGGWDGVHHHRLDAHAVQRLEQLRRDNVLALSLRVRAHAAACETEKGRREGGASACNGRRTILCAVPRVQRRAASSPAWCQAVVSALPQTMPPFISSNTRCGTLVLTCKEYVSANRRGKKHIGAAARAAAASQRAHTHITQRAEHCNSELARVIIRRHRDKSRVGEVGRRARRRRRRRLRGQRRGARVKRRRCRGLWRRRRCSGR